MDQDLEVQRQLIIDRKTAQARAQGKRKVDLSGTNPASLANLKAWVAGQSGNPNGINAGGKPGPRKASGMIHALIEMAIEDGRVDQAVDKYFDLMLKSKDDRLSFDVLRDFFDRVGLPRVTDNPKVAAQIVNVVRSNSPDLNL